ncbi:two-component sensor histidine kinase [Streptomyces lunaelactis]|uniref:sensor histidine kinase n=1 Tax=Streptomyces lunaelactis TaxID=1535768 RepID=UPI00158568A4|nr:histidine kinase [Streptomyces lunaelactis]NUK37584.1 two-component sensor histidine kinase [Streptomyces lunaelactis]NUK44366.1 two-component sensor histidine kinase [Streptomyces lunaelactis]NUK61806.1 two-component sensor histidine kinase [Streptomyces lunaelactis]NUK95181.1 two-component sensor histidine kinase [Streptomyces lunaelactis]NUL14650.1 two-component sensor histidine kinase [Streptomyces lunaelactis]
MLTTASVLPLTVLYVTEMNRTPEYRLAAGALSGLREDLFHDAFAYRPLPRRRTDGPLTRRLPGRIRDYAAWTPHAAVVALALFTLLLAYGGEGLGPAFVATGLIPAAAVVMTLLRPVGAWWLSLASTPFGVVADYTGDWPWTPSGFVSHLAVMTLVALRTRPRTAAWMWVLTAAYGLFAGVVLSGGYMSNTPEMLFVAALVLLVVTVRHVRREAKEEVAAQQTVTAVERDKRTLLEERTTIARELHDVVAHHMSVVAIQAEAAPYRVENPPPELERAFVTIRENAVAALTELRRILGVVRAEDYQAPDAPQPVLGDLDSLLDNVRDAGLEAEKTITGAVRPLPQGVELSAYRIVQEALSNALRHAPGASAKVEISYVLGGLGLRIVNTPPRGLVKPSPGAGHGITGMRERVTMLNGEITAEPTEEGGYEVTAFIPVAAAEPATASEETS